MATCSIDEISVDCPDGCGLICWNGGQFCRGWCEPTTVARAPLKATVLRASERVRLCTNELTAEAVATKMIELIDIPLRRTRDVRIEGNVAFDGSFDELLGYLGLEPDEDSG